LERTGWDETYYFIEMNSGDEQWGIDDVRIILRRIASSREKSEEEFLREYLTPPIRDPIWTIVRFSLKLSFGEWIIIGAFPKDFLGWCSEVNPSVQVLSTRVHWNDLSQTWDDRICLRQDLPGLDRVNLNLIRLVDESLSFLDFLLSSVFDETEQIVNFTSKVYILNF
jgi:hypothetical protein